jgi:hypothetical protein
LDQTVERASELIDHSGSFFFGGKSVSIFNEKMRDFGAKKADRSVNASAPSVSLKFSRIVQSMQ